ncbi:MAG: TolC family protein [Nitrospiraceae bacterium]|nr:TolC family protein [Nitrospiraceae bacterium]
MSDARHNGRTGGFFEFRVWRVALCILAFSFFLPARSSLAEEVRLRDLIAEALKNSPELRAAESRAAASRYRIPQAKSLPDPMVMIGYQNEGFSRFNYGKSEDAQVMFSASQMFPFPGKRGLKAEMAEKDAEGQRASYDALRLRVVAKVKELYFGLFLAYKEIDIIRDRTVLFSRIEDAAIARYSSGMGVQQEVLMAQAEKYMLLEKEEMQQQKIQAAEAMLNTTVGRQVNAPLGRPVETASGIYTRTLEELLRTAMENSPEIRVKERMEAAAEAKVRMARREYYPDFTVTANYGMRGGGMPDMWSLTTTLNIPLYYRAKQRQAVFEAEASQAEARGEVEAAKLMLASSIRDSYSMLSASGRLMELYRDGLIPKTYQDFEAALAGYVAGKVEAITAISRLKALLDFESLYWVQFAEREKAAARLEALSGLMEPGVKE